MKPLEKLRLTIILFIGTFSLVHLSAQDNRPLAADLTQRVIEQRSGLITDTSAYSGNFTDVSSCIQDKLLKWDSAFAAAIRDMVIACNETENQNALDKIYLLINDPLILSSFIKINPTEFQAGRRSKKLKKETLLSIHTTGQKQIIKAVAESAR